VVRVRVLEEAPAEDRVSRLCVDTSHACEVIGKIAFYDQRLPYILSYRYSHNQASLTESAWLHELGPTNEILAESSVVI